jgi:hypothetical protein
VVFDSQVLFNEQIIMTTAQGTKALMTLPEIVSTITAIVGNFFMERLAPVVNNIFNLPGHSATV